MIRKHLDKNNLHHAYLVEGDRDEIISQIFAFLKDSGINISPNNPDFYQIVTDSFKVDDARNLKSLGTEKSFSGEKNAKKIFLISTNSILLEAQNSMLKIFEEPKENTHYFVVVPDTSALIKTFVSRFYLISTRQDLVKEGKEAEEFIKMPLRSRTDFIKELLVEADGEDEDGNEIAVLDGTRSKALKFLNALESTLHNKMPKTIPGTTFFEHIFKVRKFLRMPGSSTKTLMESVALVIPNFEK